jgi:hypothetical protein
LGDSEQLKDFTVKAWLRKLAKKKEDIQPKYLMNEQEVAQNEKIERLFFKFDTATSFMCCLKKMELKSTLS